MKYTSTVTSKGTITIAAPLRKALNIKAGQKVALDVTKDNRLVVDTGISLANFEATRARVTQKIPDHLKGLSGKALHDARMNAWIADRRD